MAIRNFFSSLAKTIKNNRGLICIFLGLFVAVSCTQRPVRKPAPPVSTEPGQPPPAEAPAEPGPSEPPTAMPQPPPKLGLIFGAGGLKSFAYIGFLRELEKARIPVHALVGLEFAALPAAIYAAKGQVNDLEWQMSKLRMEDVFPTGLFADGKDAVSIDRLDEFLGKVFAQAALDDFQIRFSCPSEDYGPVPVPPRWHTRGSATAGLKACMAFPPLFQPSSEQAASAFAVEEAAKWLRGQGAELVVFINALEVGPLLPAREPRFFRERVIWGQLRRWYKKEHKGVDLVYGFYLPKNDIRAFDERRDIMKSGENTGRALAEQLVEKYRF